MKNGVILALLALTVFLASYCKQSQTQAQTPPTFEIISKGRVETQTAVEIVIVRDVRTGNCFAIANTSAYGGSAVGITAMGTCK